MITGERDLRLYPLCPFCQDDGIGCFRKKGLDLVKQRNWFGSRHKSIQVLVAVSVLVVLAGVIGVYKARHVIYRQVLLAQIAYSVPEQNTDGDLAIALLEATIQAAPAKPKVVIDDDPAGTLTRGWGYCDSVAMAYVQLLERRGLEGQLVFLRREDGLSPHTVATVNLDGTWRVMDVSYGTYSLTTDGTLASAKEIASGQAPVTWDPADPPHNLPIEEKETWKDSFKYSTLFYQTRNPGLSRSLLRTVAGWGARIAPNLIQDLYLLTPPPAHGTPYADTTWEDWSGDGSKALWRARNYDLFGRTKKAHTEYKKAIESDSDRKDEAIYFLEDGRHWSGHSAMAANEFGTNTKHFAGDGQPLPTGWWNE